MNFKTKRIQNTTQRTIRKKRGKIKYIFIFILGIVIAFYVLSAIAGAAKQVLFKVATLFAADLDTDQFGHTNILLLGSGGELHQGSDLTDTIIVASIDQDTGSITMLSIPRDLYIEHEKLGGGRINNIYNIGKNDLKNPQYGIEALRESIEEVIGTDVQYFAKIDFTLFEDLINTLGGIDMYIPETIDDPFYPRGETIYYERFYIQQGQQHLDGETALKYVRSRKTTSDFSRSKRQQAVLFAIKEKAASSGLLNSPGKLKKIYEEVQDQIITDLGIKELLRLATIGKDIDKENIHNFLLHDDPSKCGGFLYPPARELYGGAFVFIPAGKGFESIHLMVENIFNHPETSNTQIQILNGTKQGYLAGTAKVIFKRHCFNTIRFGNAQNQTVDTTTYYRVNNTPEVNATLSQLQKLVPGRVMDEVPQIYLEQPYQSGADIILELGADYLPRRLKDPFDLIVELKPKKTKEEETAEEEDEEEASQSTTNEEATLENPGNEEEVTTATE